MDYQQAYEMLRDAIMEHLDPQDDDIAEPAIMVQAIERAGACRKIAEAINEGLLLQCPDCGYMWEYNRELREQSRTALGIYVA